MSDTALVAAKEQYRAYVNQLTTQVAAALPISIRDEDLKRARANMRLAFSADAHGKLIECTGESIARAIVLSAMTGLMPGGPKPSVWLIPRKNKHLGGALEVNWQISARGFVRMCRRAGWDMEPVLVFEGERFEVEEGSHPKLVHVRNLDAPQTWPAIRYGYVRVFRAGHRDSAKIGFLSKDQIRQRRAKAQDQGFWNEWPLEMSLKTLCNYAGNRELFPLDDPARFAIDASERAELGQAARKELTVGMPAGELTEVDDDTIDAESWEPAGSGEPEVINLAPPPDPEPTAPILEEIKGVMVRHFGKDASAKEKGDALRSAFGTFKWAEIEKMDAEQLRVGLQALQRHIAGMASMRERQPGEEE